MPGRNPHEAYRAFIEPIQHAASCLGPTKIVVSAGAAHQPDTEHSWMLNGQNGYSWRGWHFEAQMNYRIIRDERPGRGPWRVTTTAYRYRLAVPEHDVFRLHWHPAGNSPVKYPHAHLALSPAARMPDSLDAHLPTARMSFEQALRWAFEVGVEARVEDWRERLDRSEAPHLEHRTWSEGGASFS